jgi:glycosyltransferase involved in cell wall biosynthesis
MTPKISVVLPVYNAAPFLAQAVDSILAQTFADFELIVLDDGSTDATPAILQRYASDGRVRLLRQPNAGVVPTLNRGLDLCTGELIARMDADDIAHPRRLEAQVRFMSMRPEVGLLGTAYRLIDAQGRDLGAQPVALNDLAIRWASLLTSPFAHPTVMMRRATLERHGLRYSAEAETVEDYDLFARSLEFWRGANLDQPLLQYRVHGQSNTGRVAKSQLKHHPMAALRQIRRLLPGFVPDPTTIAQLQSLFVSRQPLPDIDRYRAKLADTYLDLWSAFACQLGSQARPEELNALRRQVVARAARMVLRPKLPAGWRRVTQRLWSMDAGWPVWYAATMPRAVVLNLRWRAARRLFVRHHAP